MSSSSTRMRKAPFVGKPLAEATVIVVCVAVIAPESVVLAPGPTRHVYELAGVRSNGVETLLSRVELLSKVGGVPVIVVHDCVGPGMALSYHVAKSAAGGATRGAVWLTPAVAPSESLLKML